MAAAIFVLDVPPNRSDNNCMMNKAILVQTQVIENYNLDGEDDQPYWKFKGGEEYLVYGTNDRPANAMALVASLCISNSKAFKEYPVSYRTVDANFKTEFEQHQEEYDGEIKFAARRVHINKRETWKKGDYDYESSFEKTVAEW